MHLRKQVAKMNRRIMNVEIDNLQRNQREKIVCVIGIAYFLLKSFLWLNRKWIKWYIKLNINEEYSTCKLKIVSADKYEIWQKMMRN